MKCVNNMNKNRYAKHQCNKDSGTVPKNLQITNKISSSVLGYNNQYLFDTPGRVNQSPMLVHWDVPKRVGQSTNSHIVYNVRSVSEVGVNKSFCNHLTLYNNLGNTHRGSTKTCSTWTHPVLNKKITNWISSCRTYQLLNLINNANACSTFI